MKDRCYTSGFNNILSSQQQLLHHFIEPALVLNTLCVVLFSGHHTCSLVCCFPLLQLLWYFLLLIQTQKCSCTMSVKSSPELAFPLGHKTRLCLGWRLLLFQLFGSIKSFAAIYISFSKYRTNITNRNSPEFVSMSLLGPEQVSQTYPTLHGTHTLKFFSLTVLKRESLK